MKKVFLLNAFACADKIDILRESIKNAMDGEEYEIIESHKSGDLTAVAKELKGCTVFSVGGDGTLFEVINGAAESDNEVFVIPAGSGNDFCRLLTRERLPQSSCRLQIVLSKKFGLRQSGGYILCEYRICRIRCRDRKEFR